MKKQGKAWLRALSGLSINLSAGWFAASFIGLNAAFPKTLAEFFSLFWNLTFGIIFLLLTVIIERNLGK